MEDNGGRFRGPCRPSTHRRRFVAILLGECQRIEHTASESLSPRCKIEWGHRRRLPILFRQYVAQGAQKIGRPDEGVARGRLRRGSGKY